MVLGTIVHLQDPLPANALSNLLNMGLGHDTGDQNIVRQTLAGLHSVIVVPEDDTHCIRLRHSSFFDFITDGRRCLNPKLVVQGSTQHAILARACFFAMQSLRRNPCGIDDTTLLNHEVPHLQQLVRQHIPPHLEYACRHWASHMAADMISNTVLELLEEFCATSLWHWIEASSLMGDLRAVLTALETSITTLQVSQVITFEHTPLIYPN